MSVSQIPSVVMGDLWCAMPLILMAFLGQIFIRGRREEDFKIEMSAPVSIRKVVNESVLPTEQYNLTMRELSY